MPTILRLGLVPERDLILRPESGPAQGWLLALARSWDPSWAETLHGGNQRSPYALSPLHYAARVPLATEDCLGSTRFASGLLRRGEPVSLRLSLTDDERARRFLEALPHLSLPALCGVPCRLARYPNPTFADPDWLQASWAILADAPAADRLHVSFETPTAFSHRGQSLLILEPSQLLETWRRAWRYAPALPEGAEGLTPDGLRITQYALHTEPLSLKGGLRIGFVGNLVLTWRNGTPAQTRRAFAALAGLADFLGTGAKTALGMGQTRVRAWEGE